MTTYNHAPYIARAIESVLAQRTSFAVELLLGEDCSSDSTPDICRSYAARYPDRIRLVTSEHNVGMRANYRRTIEACRGRYVAICDGDDWWCDPEKLERQVAMLEADPSLGLCYTRSLRLFEGTGRELHYPEVMLTDFDRLLFNNTVENCTAVARRDLILRYYAEVRPEEHPEWLTDDAPMWLWFAAESRIAWLDAETAVHRMLPQSVSQSGLYRKRIAFCDSLMDTSLWFDARYGAGRHRYRLLCRRSDVALWVLSYHGPVGEYLARWWRDVRRGWPSTPRATGCCSKRYFSDAREWIRGDDPRPPCALRP